VAEEGGDELVHPRVVLVEVEPAHALQLHQVVQAEHHQVHTEQPKHSIKGWLLGLGMMVVVVVVVVVIWPWQSI
jgi:hypothetical protein